ncbi:MAG: shikimate dehydrogenase [Acidocella sp.]|uniref:shikimate dehydrogenase n=1 Tax=Acidocella sp. TaxID=50710 RepID=UPI003FBE9DCD
MRLLTGSARLAGVIGWPVAHSRSPRIHSTWLNRHGIDGAYVPLPVAPENFTNVVRALAQAGFAGANVTIPHKEAAFAVCDKVDETAHRAGAVNTLVFTPQGIEGRNTDGYGFVANLRAHGVNPAAGPVLILGAGGAARAIAAALQDEGAAVTICNRSPERAETLAAALPPARVLPWEQRAAALGDYALLVNTTSLGMVHNPPLKMPLEKAAPGLAVADIVYAPLQTALLAEAEARGVKAVEGLGMLLHQAVPGFAAWFGVMPQVDEELYRIVAA